MNTQGDCPHCGATLPAGAGFCTHCGRQIRAPRRCGHCGEGLLADALACAACGRRVVAVAGASCPHCAAELRPGAKFCAECGRRVGTTSTPSAKMSAQQRAQRSPDGSGLAPALISYFLCLGVLLILVASASEGEVRLEWLRVFGYVIIAIGVGSLFFFPEVSRQLLRWPQGSPAPIFRALGWLGVIILVLTGLQRLVPSIWDDVVAPYQAAGKGLGYILVDFAVLPAIGEELVFRGAVLTGLMRAFGERTGVIVSSLLFATLHLSPLSFVHLAIVGLLLAQVRLKTKSIYPCMLLHGLYNAVIVCGEWFWG